jgi:hypothetical protein
MKKKRRPLYGVSRMMFCALLGIPMVLSETRAQTQPQETPPLLRFIDRCSSRETAPVIVSGTASLELAVAHQEPHARYQITFRIRSSDPAARPLKEKQLQAETGGDGRILVRVDWDGIPETLSEAGLLKFEAEWRIAGTQNISGSTGRESVQVRSGEPRFFLHLSKSLCQRTSAWRPISNYIFNRQVPWLEIRHQADIPLADPTRGLTLLDESAADPFAPSTGDLPLNPRPRPYFGWSFPGWENIHKLPGEYQSEFRWQLPQNQGAFVGTASRHVRFAVEEYHYELDAGTQGCGTWKGGRFGELEVVRPVYQLLVVPEAQQRSSHQLARFLETAYPERDGCLGLDEPSDQPFETLDGPGALPLLFREK